MAQLASSDALALSVVGVFLIIVGIFAAVLVLVAWALVARSDDVESTERRASGAWGWTLWSLVPAATVAAAVGATFLLGEIPTFDCAVDMHAPGPPTGALAASAVALVLVVASIVTALVAATLTSVLRPSALGTRRHTAYLIAGTTTRLAAGVVWTSAVLSAYALVRFPEVAAYC